MIQDKALRTSWARKMKERQERKLVQDLARQLQEGKQREREVTGLRSWALGSGPRRQHHPAPPCLLSPWGRFPGQLEALLSWPWAGATYSLCQGELGAVLQSGLD